MEVEFDQLTDRDRSTLGKYAPSEFSQVTLWKQWHEGVEKLYGRGRGFPPFDLVRAGATAADRRGAWQGLRSERPELGLPAWSNNDAVATFMTEWEAEHPGELVDSDVESNTHFFGFAGQAVMSGLFDYIFVSADLRASEEASDARSAVIGRILELAVDRSAAESEVEALVEEFGRRQSDIHSRLLEGQLAELSSELTGAVAEFVTGRQVTVSSRQEPLKPQRVQFSVNVLDATLETRVERQGHGFQRALLIAALKLLAEHGRHDPSGAVICLAIEEPELYQHPLQARTFASVLRRLAEDPDRGVQVTYATHSPYFIEAKSFHQIRRVSRSKAPDSKAVTVRGSSVESVVARLDSFIDAESINRQLDGVCLGALGEAFFADVILLVEGSTDRAVLSGVAARDGLPFLLDGIFIGEAGGKTRLLLPYAIFDELGIPVYLLADNDSHLQDALTQATGAGDLARVKNLKASIEASCKCNRMLLRFFDLAETDWPAGAVTPKSTFLDGGLELALEQTWPAWADARRALIEDGVGFSGKDGATYEEAALQADGDVPDFIVSVIAAVRDLKAVA